jgi:hypothetical protein
MTHLEFLTLFGSFTIVGQENVSNPQTQQIRKTLAKMLEDSTENKTFQIIKQQRYRENREDYRK